jgi:hypothetical protein
VLGYHIKRGRDTLLTVLSDLQFENVTPYYTLPCLTLHQPDPQNALVIELKNEGGGKSGLENDHATPLYPQKLALTSPTSGGRSVGIVRSRS